MINIQVKRFTERRARLVVTDELKQKVLHAKRNGLMFRDMAEEWGLPYKLIVKAAVILQKEMTVEERIPYDLLTKEEVRAYT